MNTRAKKANPVSVTPEPVRRRQRSTLAQVLPLEARQLFAYDVQVLGVTASAGRFQPGDRVSATVTFKNIGDTASPVSTGGFNAFLVSGDFSETNPNGIGYGGSFLDNTNNYDIPALQPGQTQTVTLQGPLSPVSINGGPYGLYVFATGTDQQFLISDANPANNFLVVPNLGINIYNAIDGTNFGSGGTIPDISTPVPVVGDLDPTFGDNNSGVSTSTFTGTPVQTLSTVYDTTNHVQYALGQQGDDLALVRFLDTGELDTSYDGDGILTISVGAKVKAASLVRMSDGRLLLGASLADGGGAVVVRTDTGGALDASFGTNGVVQVPTATAFGAGATGFVANSLAAGADGSVFLAGSIDQAGVTGQRDMGVIKIGADGTLASGFGAAAGGGSTGGVRVDLQSKVGKTLTSNDDVARAVVVDSKGRITLAGSSGDRAVAIRLKSDGARDLTYGAKGLYTAIANPGNTEQFTAAGLGPKDYVFLGGYSAGGAAGAVSGTQAFVAQVTDRGAANGRFGTRGPRGATPGITRLTNVALAFASPNTLIATPDDGVLVSLQVAQSLQAVASDLVGAAFVRLDSAGKFVTNFGTNGVNVVLPAGTPPAAAVDTQSAFNDFLNARDGAATGVGGGKVRTLATDVSATNFTTNLRIAQIVADGADVAPSFDGTIPATIVSGTKRAVKLKVANLGTLPANGQATLELDMIPAGGGSTTATTSKVLKLKLKSGLLVKNALTLSIPKSASGLFNFVARINSPTGFTDIASGNNAVRSPTQFTAIAKTRSMTFSLGTVHIIDAPLDAPVAAIPAAAPAAAAFTALKRDRLFSGETVNLLV